MKALKPGITLIPRLKLTYTQIVGYVATHDQVLDPYTMYNSIQTYG